MHFFYSRKRSALIVGFIIAALMIGVSSVKGVSSFVYPIIGQTVVLTQEIPLIQYPNGYGYNTELPVYDLYDGTDVIIGPSDPVKRSNLQSGKMFTISKIIPTHADFELGHQFVLTGATEEFVVEDIMLRYPYKNDTQTSFCERVEWTLCNSVTEESYANINPMRYEFRLFTYLMYYPAFPILLQMLVDKTGSSELSG